jgi:hypothetical protein
VKWGTPPTVVHSSFVVVPSVQVSPLVAVLELSEPPVVGDVVDVGELSSRSSGKFGEGTPPGSSALQRPAAARSVTHVPSDAPRLDSPCYVCV